MAAARAPSAAIRPEVDVVCLARNLTSARLALGWTQAHLADVAQISRATVVQLEHGLGDPRLSTLSQIANSLGVSVIWLLMGLAEVRALGDLAITQPPDPRLQRLSATGLKEMQRLVATGMIAHRKRAAQQGAALANSAGLDSGAVVTTAISTAIYPGPGTVAGAIIGEKCSRYRGSA